MTESIAPKSDQMNSDDLMSGSRTFTIAEVRPGSSAEQPFDFYLSEFHADRPFKPSKSMRRVMVSAWGKDGSTYVGKRLTLYREPTVRFGGQEVGGIRIEAMSDLPGDKPMKLALTATRGKKENYVVKPLADEAPAPDYLEQARAATDVDEVKAIWQRAKSAGHMTDALNAALKPIGEALKTRPAPDEAAIPGTENSDV